MFYVFSSCQQNTKLTPLGSNPKSGTFESTIMNLVRSSRLAQCINLTHHGSIPICIYITHISTTRPSLKQLLPHALFSSHSLLGRWFHLRRPTPSKIIMNSSYAKPLYYVLCHFHTAVSICIHCYPAGVYCDKFTSQVSMVRDVHHKHKFRLVLIKFWLNEPLRPEAL